MDKELIERLAVEAGAAVYPEHFHPTAKVVVDRRIEPEDMDVERFAALIAEECAKQAERTHAPFTAYSIREKFSPSPSQSG